MMRIGFWLCLFCMIPGLLIRVPLGGAGILLSDLMLPLFGGVFVLHQIIVKRHIPTPYFLISGSIFGALALISWLLNAWSLDLKAQIISFSYLVRWVSLIIFGVAAGEIFNPSLKHNPEDPSSLLPAPYSWLLSRLFAILAIILLFGFLQFFILPDIGHFSTVGGFDPHIGRFLGTWMDPNFVAGLLAFFVPVMLGTWYGVKNLGTWKLKNAGTKENYLPLPIHHFQLTILILLALLALFLTFSRSGYLAAGLGIGLFFLFRDPKILLIGALVMSLGISLNPRATQRVGELTGTLANVVFQETDEVDPTAMLRFESWSKTLELWQKYPVFGIGYNTYRYIASEEGLVDENYFSSGGSDSSLLTILVTTGIAGFIAFALWYLQIWFHHLRRWYKAKFTLYPLSSTPYELHLGIWAGWTALLLHSFFVNSLLFPLILMPVMAVVGAMRE